MFSKTLAQKRAEFSGELNLHLPVLTSDGKNSSDFYVADVIGSKRFTQNYGGFPRSDIALINSTPDVELQAAIASSLVDYSQDSNPNAGKSDVEIALSLKSKYCQAPGEMIPWLERRIADRDAKRAAAAAEQVSSESKIDFKSDKEIIDNV